LRFAWIECDQTYDGIAFSYYATKYLGWRNLLGALPRGGRGRIDRGHPSFDIRWHSDRDERSGLLLRPTQKGGETEFLSQWVYNPGVNRQKGCLTSGMDYAKGNKKKCQTDFQADLVALSGHGADGAVFGDWHRKLPRTPRIEFRRWIMANYARAPCTGRVKYLIIPACFNLSSTHAHNWLPAHRKPAPIHGILGYTTDYKGGVGGAVVMWSFMDLLKKNRRMTILEAWKKANDSLKWDWGATILDAARQDTMHKWISTGLSVPAGSLKVLRFDAKNWPNGTELRATRPPIEAIFHMANGTAITPANNSGSNAQVGLFPGQRGYLLLKYVYHHWNKGDKLKVVFYHYRAQHDQTDLKKLLVFDSKPTLKLLRDQNKLNNTRHYDAFEYTVPKDNTNQIKLEYKVLDDAHKNYPEDGNNAGTYGRFWVSVYEPGRWDPIDLGDYAAWLRKPTP